MSSSLLSVLLRLCTSWDRWTFYIVSSSTSWPSSASRSSCIPQCKGTSPPKDPRKEQNPSQDTCGSFRSMSNSNFSYIDFLLWHVIVDLAFLLIDLVSVCHCEGLPLLVLARLSPVDGVSLHKTCPHLGHAADHLLLTRLVAFAAGTDPGSPRRPDTRLYKM